MLERLTLAYLFSPSVFFFHGWLRPFWAWTATALLGAMIIRVVRTETSVPADPPSRSSPLFWTFAAALAWTLLSGAGGFGYQNATDWIKHNSVLKDLIERPWPVAWDGVGKMEPAGEYRLVYYLSYYLPAAAVGKLVSWKAANAALFAWTLGGAWLVLLWFTRLCGARRVRAFVLLPLFFIFASGLDAAGAWLVHKQVFLPVAHIEWWGRRWSFYSNTTQFFWAPQHALGGWLSASLLLSRYFDRRPGFPLALPFVAAMAWTPLTAIGLVPILVAVIRKWGVSFRSQALPAAGALFFLLLYASYYASLAHRLPGRIYPPSVLSWDSWLFAKFYFLEAGAYLLVLLWSAGRPEDREERPLAAAVAAGLFLLCFVRVGINNDFVLRSTMPCLLALWVLTARRLGRAPGTAAQRGVFACLAALFAFGALTPSTEIFRSLRNYETSPPRWESVLPVYKTGIGSPRQRRQYIGRAGESFFYNIFGK